MSQQPAQATKIDLTKDLDKLSKIDIGFIKKAQKLNQTRVEQLNKLKRRNLFTGLALCGLGFVICKYFNC